MAARGLGKGLDSLIPAGEMVISNKPQQQKEETTSKHAEMLVKINKVEPNREQPRKNFDEDALQELADSIKQFGLLQPILVQDRGDYFEIIAGERRWRAAKLAGLKEVPVIIKKLTEKQIMEISLIENIQRQDLNPIEEAMAYKKLINDFKITQEELSKRIGKSRVAIANTMRLMNLDTRVQEYLIEGIISEGHGRVLLGIEDMDLQYQVAQQVIDEKWSVRYLEKLVKKMNENKDKAKEEVELDTVNVNPYYKELKDQLQNYFGTKVNISNKKNKGKIEIEYYSEDDLQRILDIINMQ